MDWDFYDEDVDAHFAENDGECTGTWPYTCSRACQANHALQERLEEEREKRHDATFMQLAWALDPDNPLDLSGRVTRVIDVLGVWKRDADHAPSGFLKFIHEDFPDHDDASELDRAVEFVFMAYDFETGTFPKYPTFDSLSGLRNEAIAVGHAARIRSRTRREEAILAAAAAEKSMSRTKRRNLHKAEKRLAAASSPGSSDAATPVAKHAARDDAAGASGSAPCGGSPGIDTPSPYPFPSSTEAAAAVSSASSTQAAPPGAENEDTAHRASGIVIHKTTICQANAAHAESTTPAPSTSSTQAAPMGAENEDTAHHASGIVIHKTTITKTNAAHVDFADILYVPVFFAIIIDLVAVVVKNSCIYSICVLVSLAIVLSVANALTSGSTVLSARVPVADADSRVRTASIPDG
jgi:hypothetical protein